MASLDPRAVAAFREQVAGEVLLPGDPRYDEARVVWNAMIDRRPAIVVRASGTADILTSVLFAREHELLVAVRSGGHSIPGFSTCDGGIVIDLSRMRGVRVDPERRVATVNGGAPLAELDREAQAFGLVCPVGVVAHTGVAGLTLGGGMGRLQRKLGLTIDSLRGIDLVTADGRLVHAGGDEEPDLFWGIRGAGANFGIVTSFAFDLHPLDPIVTHGFVMYPVERAHEIAAVFRELAETGPDELFVTFGMGLALPLEDFPSAIAGRPVAYIGVQHCGTTEAAEKDLAALRALGRAPMDTIGPKNYLAVQHMNDEAMRWGHRFYMKSAFMPALPGDMVEACAASVSQVPAGGECGFSIWAWGRAIAQVPDEATAFTGRDAAFWVAAEALWDDAAVDDLHREWARASMATLAPFTRGGRYVNDVVESGDDVVRSVYGDAKYERLVAVKRKWDPDNVFRLNQNVRP